MIYVSYFYIKEVSLADGTQVLQGFGGAELTPPDGMTEIPTLTSIARSIATENEFQSVTILNIILLPIKLTPSIMIPQGLQLVRP